MVAISHRINVIIISHYSTSADASRISDAFLSEMFQVMGRQIIRSATRDEKITSRIFLFFYTRFKQQEDKTIEIWTHYRAGFVENKRCEKDKKYLTGDARTEHNIVYETESLDNFFF